jgi:hypothetical protein
MSYDLRELEGLGELGFSLKPPKFIRKAVSGAAKLLSKAAPVIPFVPFLAPLAPVAFAAKAVSVARKLPGAATIMRAAGLAQKVRQTPAVAAATRFAGPAMQGIRRIVGPTPVNVPRGFAQKVRSKFDPNLPLGMTTKFTRSVPRGIDRGTTQGPAARFVRGQLSRGARIGKIGTGVGPTAPAATLAPSRPGWLSKIRIDPALTQLRQKIAASRQFNVAPEPVPDVPVPALIPPSMAVPISQVSPSAAAWLQARSEPVEAPIAAAGINPMILIGGAGLALLMLSGNKRGR